jgi:hypothetical protein
MPITAIAVTNGLSYSVSVPERQPTRAGNCFYYYNVDFFNNQSLLYVRYRTDSLYISDYDELCDFLSRIDYLTETVRNIQSNQP